MDLKKSGSLKALLIFLLFSISLKAQIDTLTVGETVISAQRTPVLYSESSRILTIITKSEIENSPSRNITEIINYAVSLDVRQRSAHGMQADVSIRGGSFDQCLILLNGVKLNNTQTGHHNMDLPVDPGSIERIEILEGPGSRIYGTNAFNGAINIITGNKKPKRSAGISFAVGENEYLNLNFNANHPIGKLNNYISINKISSEGYTTNTDYDLYNFFYNSSLRLKNLDLRLDAGYTNKAFGAYKYYSLKYPLEFEHTKTTFANLSLNSGKKVKYSLNFYWKRHRDRFELLREDEKYYQRGDNYWFSESDTISWYKGHNYHMTDIYGSNFNLSYKSKFGVTSFGGEFSNDRILSNVLGEPMSDTVFIKSEEDGYYNHAKSRNTLGFFIEHNLKTKKIGISTGFYTDLLSNSSIRSYPGIDIHYKIFKKSRIFMSINKSLRLPTFTDLYYSGPENSGNPNLKPEEAITYEAGYKYRLNGLAIQLSAYKRFGINIIDWVRRSDTLLWESKNITELVTNGYEISCNYFPTQDKSRSAIIKHLRFSYALLNISKQSKDYISKYALDYLKHKISVSLRHKIYKSIYASWQYCYLDRAGTYTLINPSREIKYKSANILDLRIYTKYKKFKISIEGTNLLNQTYVDFGSIERPGRWIMLGIQFNTSGQ